MNDTMFLIIRIIVSVLACLIGYGMKKYLYPILRRYKEKLEKEEVWDEIVAAVEAAEQVIKGSGKGKLKKEKVLGYILEYLNEKGINITEKQLDQLIESAVFNMNSAKDSEINNIDIEKLKQLLETLKDE